MGERNFSWVGSRIKSTICNFSKYSICYFERNDLFLRGSGVLLGGRLTWRSFFKKRKEIPGII
jgi:hypothetical protein